MDESRKYNLSKPYSGCILHDIMIPKLIIKLNRNISIKTGRYYFNSEAREFWIQLRDQRSHANQWHEMITYPINDKRSHDQSMTLLRTSNL